MNDASDLKSRKDLSRLVGVGAFALTYLVFVVSRDWGFLLGLVPALLAGAIFAWISYRHFWLGIAIGAVFQIFSMLG